jgi:RNA polymerase sigma-70 factor (ECF subfamily)
VRSIDPANDAGHTPLSTADRDRQLVACFRQGDETAFDELFQLYFQPVRDYLRRRTDDVQAAEDAAQVAFINAYYALRKDDRDVHFQGWIRRIARNTHADLWRWSQRQKRPEEAELEEDSLPERILANELSAVGRPHLSAERQETVERFWLVASTLPRDQYHVLLLRLKYGRSSREAAEVLGKEPSAIDVLFQEAKRSLPEAGYAALAKAAPNLVPCLQLRALVITFHPGLLTGDERKRINRHVRNCPACQEHRQSLDRMDLFAPRQPRGGALFCLGGVVRSGPVASLLNPSGGDSLAPGAGNRKRRHLPLPNWPTQAPPLTWTVSRWADPLSTPPTRPSQDSHISRTNFPQKA